MRQEGRVPSPVDRGPSQEAERKTGGVGWVSWQSGGRDGRVPGVNASCPLPGPGALGKAPDPLCLGPPVSPMGPWDPRGSIVRHVKHLK